MTKIRIGAATIGVFFLLTGCGVSGQVTNKRAPGWPGEKTFQIQVDDQRPGVGKVWVTVPEDVWERCSMVPADSYPACAG